jgi:L,D-transpeptidase ErfK/SrfK
LKPGQAPKTYALGIGREGLLTPSGTTSIIAKKKDPVWRPTARMRRENPLLPAEVPAGPDNPLGAYALYLGWPEYRIHSTDKPYSIGRRASSGCIRMYPDEAEEGFKIFPTGIQVTVVNQSVKVGWIEDKLFLEATPTMEQADTMEVDGGLPGYVFPEEDMGIIVASAGAYAKDLDWQLIRQIIRERRGYPVEIFQKAAAPKAVETVVEKSPEIVPEKSEEKAAVPDDKGESPVEGAAVEKMAENTEGETKAPRAKRILTTPN